MNMAKPMSTTVLSTSVLCCCVSSILPSFFTYADGNTQFSLSQQIDEEALNLGHYWASEKLDGIRALWTGEHFLTRKGNRLSVPDWFTAKLPDRVLEGELWAGRGRFKEVQKVVMKENPAPSDWHDIKFMLFDLPGSKLSQQAKYRELQEHVDTLQLKHVKVIEQLPVSSYDTLIQLLQETEDKQGEGVMLKKFDGSDSGKIIKIKKYMDSEGTVIGYKPGKGKYQAMVGALIVKIEGGRVLSIGSGLSDVQRANPPALGELVTFRYNGYTSSGLPRFARFVRVREVE